MTDPTTTTAQSRKAAEAVEPLRFYLGEDDFDGQVLVSLESFLRFDNQMAHRLDSLERTWADWSTRKSLRRAARSSWQRV